MRRFERAATFNLGANERAGGTVLKNVLQHATRSRASPGRVQCVLIVRFVLNRLIPQEDTRLSHQGTGWHAETRNSKFVTFVSLQFCNLGRIMNHLK
jgi:hypothetical protein